MTDTTTINNRYQLIAKLGQGRMGAVWRKYSSFERYADIVMTRFPLSLENEGNLKQTWRQKTSPTGSRFCTVEKYRFLV